MKNYMKLKSTYYEDSFCVCVRQDPLPVLPVAPTTPKTKSRPPLSKRLSHLPKSLGLLYLFRSRYSKTR